MGPFNAPYMAEALRREEELRALGVTPEQMAAQRQQSAMQRQFAPNAADIATIAAGEGVEGGNLERARSMAAQMRGRDMPTGKTVGPSGIYVENPYEQIGAALERLGGGLLDRKASQYEQETVEPKRQALAKAQAAEAARKSGLEQYEVLQKLQQGDRGVAVQEGQLGLAGKRQEADDIFRNLQLETQVSEGALDRAADADNLDTRLNSQEIIAGADRDLRRELAEADTAAQREAITLRHTNALNQLAQENQNNLDSSWKATSYYDGNNVKTYVVNDAGEFRLGTSEGKKMTPVEVMALVPFKAGAESGSAPAAANAALIKAQRAMLLDDTARNSNMEVAKGQIADVLNNYEDLETYAGALNVPRFLATKMGIGEDAWKAQSTDMKLKGLALSGIAKYAEVFKPMSDTDVNTIMESMPSFSNEPLTIVSYFANEGRSKINEIYQQSRAAAIDSGDEAAVAAMDAAYQEMDDDLLDMAAMAAKQLGMSPEDAEKRGIPAALML